MSDRATPARAAVAAELVGRARVLAEKIRARAAAAEEARRLPQESARELIAAGFARILIPQRFGGYALGFDTWYDVVRELARADASHAWCTSLMIHHAHMVAQFSDEAQQAVWAAGPDLLIACSIAPIAKIVRVDGGYRVSGEQSTFASGVDHCAWAMVGGLAPTPEGPDWHLFLMPRGDFEVRDVWHTSGMRATGSNTIVTDDVFVPEARALRMADLRMGQGPGAAINTDALFRTPFYFYAPLTFATPVLGAAQGAYAHFRDSTRTRRLADGTAAGELANTQVRMARAAADIDAADLLLRRTLGAAFEPDGDVQVRLARSLRDFVKATELCIAAIDGLMALGGTAGFAAANPVQRAWRDIHFGAMHITLNPELNYVHFARMEFGLPRDPKRAFL